jgi:7,8-dihydroneopterin aldolase/epimerase/oxygenase
MATLQISSIHLRPIIGVYPTERLQPQDVYLDVTIDFTRNDTVDQLASTLDYAPIVDSFEQLAHNIQPQLIETFAEAAAHVCLAYESVNWVEIGVRKPAALKNGSAKVVIRKDKDYATHSN